MHGGKTDVVEFGDVGPVLCVHHIPGRLRLKGRGLRGHSVALGTLCDAILAIDGVTDAVPRRLTGSLVVHYDHVFLSPDALDAQLALLGIRTGTQTPSPPSEEPFDRIVEAIGSKLCEHAIERLAMAAIAAI